MFYRKHKFNAVRCERDDIKFPSKLERSCYDQLKLAQDNGQILFFLRQIPFDLPNGKKHFVDFCVFFNEEMVFIEAKGRDLPAGKLKREIVEATYPVKIHVVKNMKDLREVLGFFEKLPHPRL